MSDKDKTEDSAEGQDVSDSESCMNVDRPPYKHLGHTSKAFSVLNSMRK